MIVEVLLVKRKQEKEERKRERKKRVKKIQQIKNFIDSRFTSVERQSSNFEAGNVAPIVWLISSTKIESEAVTICA